MRSEWAIAAGALVVSAVALSAATDGQPATPMAGQRFKNLQVLGDIPADRLVPAMQFISNSLRVECGYCHADDGFEKDDRPAKRTARRMIQMELAVNRDHFDGHMVVTCNSCHRGELRPHAVPEAFAVSASPTSSQAERPIGSNATAHQLIARYLRALGGASALRTIVSRHETGTLVIDERPIPFEILTKSPGKRIEITHRDTGDTISAFDTEAGWTVMPGAPAVPVSPAAADYFKFDADLQWPLHIEQTFATFHVGTPERVRGRIADVLMALRKGQPSVTMYFDRSTGLLVRIVRETETPIGANPSQIDLEDYRLDHSVRIPFRRTFAQFRYAYTIDINAVEQNVPIADSRFTRP